ncbi:hypothetical protein VNO78_09476 [Psophocarpus tetragonolobus]|uniref:Uncharacterized protein n=1 Tax=Psophocarpus tetragonolobus TaxID=3891 RepID=A0AAN9T6P7_PSOTE
MSWEGRWWSGGGSCGGAEGPRGEGHGIATSHTSVSIMTCHNNATPHSSAQLSLHFWNLVIAHNTYSVFSIQYSAMAINICSEKSSPRISFSHDPKITNEEEPDISELDSGSDFVFCISNGVAHKLSSADELFSNGKIIPTTQITRAGCASNAPPHEQQQHYSTQKKKMLKEFLSEPEEEEDMVGLGQEQTPSSKFFWRSSSVNCERGKSMIRSSLHFLSRSYSTGSTPTTPKHAVIAVRESNTVERHRLHKQSSGSSLSFSSSSSASSSAYYFYDSCQNPSFKKYFPSASANRVPITPILNLPHHKATRSIFRFGSLFCNSKIKRKK